MLVVVALILGAVALSTATLSFIGPCDVNVETQPGFDFDQFSTENGGQWDYYAVPDTEFDSKLDTLSLTTTPTGKTPGEYHTVITYTLLNGTAGVLADEIVDNDGNGVVTAKDIDGNEFKIYFLKYVPGRYAYYYICSKDGGDQSLDYRYVVGHDDLTEAEEAEIIELDKKFNFKGSL